MSDADRVKRRAAARNLFAATGVTVEERLKWIEADATKLLERAELKADDKRWAIRHLQLCSRTFCEPAPPALVQLIEKIVAVPGTPSSRVRNRVMWRAAAKYVADHPRATPRQVATALDYNQWNVIRRWMDSADWQEERDYYVSGGG